MNQRIKKERLEQTKKRSKTIIKRKERRKNKERIYESIKMYDSPG